MGAYGAGTITVLNGTIVPAGSAQGSYTVAVQGVASNTLVVEGSLDGTTWYTLPVAQETSTGFGAIQSSITADGLYSIQEVELINVRVRASAYSSGTINVTLYGDDVVCGEAVQSVSLVGGGNSQGGVPQLINSVVTNHSLKTGSGIVTSVANLAAVSLLGTVTLILDGVSFAITSVLGVGSFSLPVGSGWKFSTSCAITTTGLTPPTLAVAIA